MQVELTTNQAKNLLQLIDLAVKAAGLNAAQAALDLATIVQKALDAEEAK